jgi:hypothetical protein
MSVTSNRMPGSNDLPIGSELLGYRIEGLLGSTMACAGGDPVNGIDQNPRTLQE